MGYRSQPWCLWCCPHHRHGLARIWQLLLNVLFFGFLQKHCLHRILDSKMRYCARSACCHVHMGNIYRKICREPIKTGYFARKIHFECTFGALESKDGVSFSGAKIPKCHQQAFLFRRVLKVSAKFGHFHQRDKPHSSC